MMDPELSPLQRNSHAVLLRKRHVLMRRLQHGFVTTSQYRARPGFKKAGPLRQVPPSTYVTNRPGSNQSRRIALSGQVFLKNGSEGRKLTQHRIYFVRELVGEANMDTSNGYWSVGFRCANVHVIG